VVHFPESASSFSYIHTFNFVNMKSIAIVLAAIASPVLADGCSKLHLVYARATTEPPANVPRAESMTDEAYSAVFEAAALNEATGSWSKGYGGAGASLVSNLTGVEMRSLTKVDVLSGKKVTGFTPYVDGATAYAVEYPV
jgi:hypothetical protein